MESETIKLEVQNNVAILCLNRGVTNPINPGMVHELNLALQSVRRQTEYKGLVISSANEKFFSIGFDIPELYGMIETEFSQFYRSFNRLCLELYCFPKPVVAALTGHAIAGGCILALCCDYRFISSGRKLMGLNEVKLGLPVPYPAACILRDLVGSRFTRQVTEGGDFFDPETAAHLGMVDRVLSAESVVSTAIDRVHALGELPQTAFAAIKRSRVGFVENQILASLDETETEFINQWYAPEARQLLREAMARF